MVKIIPHVDATTTASWVRSAAALPEILFKVAKNIPETLGGDTKRWIDSYGSIDSRIFAMVAASRHE